jgi:folylpolyglutamate synthase/dihydropteroate synthase
VVEPDLERALQAARELAEEHATGEDDAEESGVVVFGSITLVAKVLQTVREHGWS